MDGKIPSSSSVAAEFQFSAPENKQSQPLTGKRDKHPDETVELYPQDKRKCIPPGLLGCYSVPYIMVGGIPEYSVSGDFKLTPATGDITQVYHPEVALLNPVLSDEIHQIIEGLYFLPGLYSRYDHKGQALALGFDQCIAKTGELFQLAMLLGVTDLKNTQPHSECSLVMHNKKPTDLYIRLNEGFFTCRFANDTSKTFKLPVSGINPTERLKGIYLLLLERVLGEWIYSRLIMDLIQSPITNQEKDRLLKQLANFDRMTTDDPARLGFRICLKEMKNGLGLGLSCIDLEFCQKTWYTSCHQALLEKVGSCLPVQFSQEGEESLWLHVSPQQLADKVKQERTLFTGITFLDVDGRILSAPHILSHGSLASPGGHAKVRFHPLLAALAEANSEANMLPTNLNQWHYLNQEVEAVPLNEIQSNRPTLLWDCLSKSKRTRTGSGNQEFYIDSYSGKEWHIKWYSNEAIARNEVLATKLYKAAGIPVIDRHLFHLNGRWCTVSEFVPFEHLKWQDFSEEEMPSLYDGFAADAWLANWDIPTEGNLCSIDGQVYRVDCGAALNYRGLGGKKGDQFSHKVRALTLFLDSKVNSQGSMLFANIQEYDIVNGASKVLAIPHSTIATLVIEYGPTDPRDQNELIVKLLARQEDIAKKYPKLKNKNCAIYLVEPGGFDASQGIRDSGDPVPEFYNDGWTWLDFRDIRGGKKGLLRTDCRDIFSYLAFEEKRISIACQVLFPGLTVEISGAHADLKPDDAVKGITRQDHGLLPGRHFGEIHLAAVSNNQNQQASEWLLHQGFYFEQTRGLIKVSDNPYLLYRRLLEASPANPGSSHFIEPKGFQDKSLKLNWGQALSLLPTLGEKLAAASIYKSQQHKKELPSYIPEIDYLMPLNVDGLGVGLYCDKQTAQLYFLRNIHEGEKAKHWLLMTLLAEKVGAVIPGTMTVKGKENTWMITPWVDNLLTGKCALEVANPREKAKIFLASAWLGNNEISSIYYQHFGLDEQGRLFELNWSGSGCFGRYSDRKKQDDNGEGGFLGTVFELQSLRKQTQSDSLWNLTDWDINQALPAFISQAATGVDELVERLGPVGFGERRYLKSTLYERLNYIAMHFTENLPPFSEAEYLAVKINGLHGTERSVNCKHIQNHNIVIGHRFDKHGQPQTQVSLRLSDEKALRLSKGLGLGQSYNNLINKLKYFLELDKKPMTPVLREDIQETIREAEALQQRYMATRLNHSESIPNDFHFPGKIDLTEKGLNEMVQQELVDNKGLERIKKYNTWIDQSASVIDDLNNCIIALKQHTSVDDGELLKPQGIKVPTLLPTLPSRVRSDWSYSLPYYEPKDNRWQETDGPEIEFKHSLFLYRVTLSQSHDIEELPRPKQQVELQFHGPDTKAFFGHVRLITHGQGKESIKVLFQWLEGLGLDLSRPNKEIRQQHYEEQLARRADSSLFAGSVGTDRNTARWEDNTLRVNGRCIYLLPEDRRLDAFTRASVNPIHNLHYTYQQEKTDPVISLLNGNLSLIGPTGRINQGGRTNHIGWLVENNIDESVFTKLHKRHIAMRWPHLILKNWLLNRVDQVPVNPSAIQYQPWYCRHNIRAQGTMTNYCIWANFEPACVFNGPISLPESLDYMIVHNEEERGMQLQKLSDAGFKVWPDGRPISELVKVKRTLKDDFNDCIGEDSALIPWQRSLVKLAGLDQFQKVLENNPQLFQGFFISLAGIKLSNLTLTAYKLANFCWNNTQLDNIIFVDCIAGGVDFRKCHLHKVHWRFTATERSAEDIEYLSNHLEAIHADKPSLQSLLGCFNFLNATGQQSKAIEWLARCNPEPLLNQLEDRSGSMAYQKVQCRVLIGKEALVTPEGKEDARDLCEYFSLLEKSDHRTDCWKLIKSVISDTNGYKLLELIKFSHEDYPALKSWVAEEPHPKLYKPLFDAAMLVEKAQKKVEMVKLAMESFPDSPEFSSIHIADVIYRSKLKLPVTLLFSESAGGLELTDFTKALSTTADKYNPSDEEWLKVHEMARDLWPGSVTTHECYIAFILEQSMTLTEGGKKLSTPELLIRSCNQAMDQLNSEEDRETLLLALVELVSEKHKGYPEHKTLEAFLGLCFKNFGESRTFTLLTQIKDAVKTKIWPYTMAGKSERLIPLFKKGLELYPQKHDLYLEYIQTIDDVPLASPESAREELKTQVCLTALNNLCKNKPAFMDFYRFVVEQKLLKDLTPLEPVYQKHKEE